MAAAPGDGPNAITLPLGGRESAAADRSETTAGARSFAAGDLVASRWRIVRLLGTGGMGEVYEAEDTELHDRVALKALPARLAGDKGAIERMRREVQLARKVTHKNVCRIFDLGLHEEGGQATAFLTMELLTGETLAERLTRSGPLTTQQALPLLTQMSAALDEAHAAGVLHRDLKSANVLLVPSDAGERAMLMDFGIARRREGGSDPGTTYGSPEYMAPEQLAGFQVTAAADIYALGVVAYEMVTGELPFPRDALPARRLVDPPASPRNHAPDLAPQWDAALLRCLERQPQSRFASGAEFVRALAKPKPSRKRAAALVAVALAAGALAVALALQRRVAPPAAFSPRRSVAVLGFRNLSGHADEAWISKALAEMLAGELAAGERLRIVDGESVARAKKELALADADGFARDTLAHLRQNLGADTVVAGSYTALGAASGGRIRLELRAQDAITGETFASVSESGTEAGLLDLVARSGAHLRQRYGLTLPEIELRRMRASQPANPQAAQLYAEGMARMWSGDPFESRRLLERAVSADPGFALAHASLAQAADITGQGSLARAEAERALQLSPQLSREERLHIEKIRRHVIADFAGAAEVGRKLVELFPDQLQYGVDLVNDLRQAGKAAESLEVLASLRKMPLPPGAQLTLDLQEGFEYAQGGRPGEAIPILERLRLQGQQMGLPYFVAHAAHQLAYSRMMLGQLDEASRDAEQSIQLFSAIDMKQGIAIASVVMSSIERRRGDLTGASKRLEKALAMAQEVATKEGRVPRIVGRYLAMALLERGDLHTAEALIEVAQPGMQARVDSLDGRSQIPPGLSAGGRIRFARGDLAGAPRLCLLALPRSTPNKQNDSDCQTLIGEVYAAGGELQKARERHEAALKLREEFPFESAESRVALSQLALEEKKPARAEELARTAASEFAREKSPDKEGEATAALALALQAQGKDPEAQEAISRALTLAGESASVRARDAVWVAAARVANGDRPRVRGRLAALAGSLAEAGMIAEELAVRLALAELDEAAHAPGARAALEALAARAQALGFAAFARRARR